MRVTFDTNAIIALENNEPIAADLREIMAMHAAGAIKICVSAIAASERDRDPTGAPHFDKFEARLAGVDLQNAELLYPSAYFDVTFWDRCVWADDNEILEPKLREILFPNLNVMDIEGQTLEDHFKRERKARNALCDILGLWCHIKYGGDLFVTNDSIFLKEKKPRLLALGAKNILNAHESLGFLRASESHAL